MNDAPGLTRNAVRFAIGVLVVAVLYWAQPVIVPVVLAVLLSFVLDTGGSWLQRFLGRVGAVLVVVVLTFGGAGAAGWAVTQQMAGIVWELPSYRDNILHKIKDVKSIGKGASVEDIQDAVADIQKELDSGQRGARRRRRWS